MLPAGFSSFRLREGRRRRMDSLEFQLVLSDAEQRLSALARQLTAVSCLRVSRLNIKMRPVTIQRLNDPRQ